MQRTAHGAQKTECTYSTRGFRAPRNAAMRSKNGFTGASMIKFSQVNKRYPGGYEALKRVSFEVAEGELIFLTGHSGAGKSTLLKLIAAIERPNGGSVVVRGQNVGSLKGGALPYLRRHLGLVF